MDILFHAGHDPVDYGTSTNKGNGNGTPFAYGGLDDSKQQDAAYGDSQSRKGKVTREKILLLAYRAVISARRVMVRVPILAKTTESLGAPGGPS